MPTSEEWLLIRVAVKAVDKTVGTAARVAWRFTVGLPLSGRPKTNASWLYGGSEPLDGATPHGRWSYRPGWQRMLIRWAVLGAVVGTLTGYAVNPVATNVALVVAAAAGVALAVWLRRRRSAATRHQREVVEPCFETLARYIGLDQTARASDWLWIDPNMSEAGDEPVVRLALPRGLDANSAVQGQVNGVISRHVASNLVPSWRVTEATWRKRSTLPSTAPYAGDGLSSTEVPIGVTSGNKPLVVNMQTDSPHWFVTATTGAGKSSTLRVPAAHCRARGMLIDIIDPKRRSFPELVGVPGIRVHTDIESQMRALEEMYVDMLGVNAAIERGADESEFPQRMLIIDEFGSFMTAAKRRWKRLKAAGEVEGDPPFADQFMYLAWQGRQAQRFLVIGVHQPNLQVFGSSDVRQQFGTRILTGSFSRSLWVMTFGNTPRISWNSKIKGRGVVGLGESEDQIKEAQIAWISPDDGRKLAMTGPTPPAWFVNAELAPWVTDSVIDEARRLAGVSLLSPGGTTVSYPAETADPVRGDDGTGGTPARPAILPVPAPPESAEPTPDDEFQDDSEANSGPFPVVPTPHPPYLRPVSDDENLIIGLAAAAEFLGYPSKGAFEQARKRWKRKHGPIPGEKLTSDGRPCWSPHALRNWQAGLPIAGGKWAAAQDDEA